MLKLTPQTLIHTTFIVLAVLLSGCAGQVNMLPTLSQQTQLQPDQGIVVARIINASAYPLPFNQLTIDPENLNESKNIKPERLLALETQPKSSTVFSSPVKAGNYALSSIRAFHSAGDYWYSRFISSDAKFGTFEVKPGQITDLGTLIYYPKSQDDKYINTLLRLPNNNKGEVLRKFFSFYPANTNELLDWNADDYSDDRNSLFTSAAQNPVAYNKRYLAPDNSVYFLCKLGVIIKRTPKGDWEIDAVDTELDLTSVAQNSQGDLIVGGEEGRLFWKPANRDWVDISLDHSYEIEELLLTENRIAHLIARQRAKLTIFTNNLNHPTSSWNTVDFYTSLHGWNSMPIPVEENEIKKPKRPKHITGASLSKIADTTRLKIYTLADNLDPIFNNSKTEIFGFDTDTAKVFPISDELDISSILPAGAITLGIKTAGFWSWNGRSTYLKYIENDGTWEEISTFVYKCNDDITEEETCLKDGREVKSKKANFNLRAIPWFINEQDALAIVSFSNYDFWSGQNSQETKILITKNGGKSWSDTGNSLPEKHCASLVPEILDRLLISCNGGSMDFYESVDNAKSWKHVRQHENF